MSEYPRDFQIQPNANNSITIWIKDYPVHVIADHRDLVIIVPEEMEVEVSSNGLRLRRKRAPEVTIEEMSGSIDFSAA